MMRQVEIAGSYYELGLKYGRIVAENKLNWWWKQPTESALALVKECEREIAVHAPGLLEEIRGIADACESEYDLVLANMTMSYWELSACNVIAVSGNQCRNGKTIFARNHDWLDEDQEWVTCFRTHVSTGLPHIGFGFADVGRSGGVNQEGLAISSAAIWTGQAKAWSAVSPRYTLGTGHILRHTGRGRLSQAHSTSRCLIVPDCRQGGADRSRGGHA